MSEEIEVLKKLLSGTKRNQNGCLISYIDLDRFGYTRIRYKGKKIFGHRFIMFIMKDLDSDTIPVLHKDEVCSSRACIEFNHLKIGTFSENSRDMITKHGSKRKGIKYIGKLCKKGHIREPNGRCKECAQRSRDNYARKLKNV